MDWRAGRMILFEGLFRPFRAFIFAMQLLTQGVARRNFKEISVG